MRHGDFYDLHVPFFGHYSAQGIWHHNSGKTAALAATAICQGVTEPDGFSLIGRLHMPELEATTMKTFLEMVPENYGEWHDTKKIWTFSNGHQIIFKHLDMSDPKVIGHIKSMNLSNAYLDEATEISQEIYFLLLGCLRRKTALRHLVRMASNPAGHDWVWRNFFDPARRQELKASNRGIIAPTASNKFLAPEFLEGMLNTYPEDWAQRFIYASFADFSDMVYKEFTEETHCWDPSIPHKIFADPAHPQGQGDPPLSWPTYLGIDIGSDVDPWAICFGACSPDGSIFQYAQLYTNSMLIRDIAEGIKERIGGRKIAGIAYDYANRQCALELADHGISGTPAIKEVEPGLFQTAQYIHVDKRLTHPFNLKVEGSPRYFVSKLCRDYIDELQSYVWARDRSGNLTGEPAHQASHGPDSLRYLLRTFRPEPKDLPLPRRWERDSLDQLSREFWAEEEKRKDPMAKFKSHTITQHTMAEWKKLAESGVGKRFLKPQTSRFLRAGHR